jgi:hypothetical protein
VVDVAVDVAVDVGAVVVVDVVGPDDFVVVVGGGLDVVVVAGLVVLGALDGVVDVDGVGVVVEDVGEPLAVVDVDPEAVGGLASSPLLCSADWTSCCTVATWEATAAGVPPAPSAGSAFSCFRSLSSVDTSACVGWDFSVTTSWSASAVVVHAGQS